MVVAASFEALKVEVVAVLGKTGIIEEQTKVEVAIRTVFAPVAVVIDLVGNLEM